MGNSYKAQKKAKADRLKRRQKWGPLYRNRITPRAYHRYRRALLALFTFWFINELSPTTPDEIDRRVADFVESQWAEGEPSYISSNALAGLRFFSRSKAS